MSIYTLVSSPAQYCGNKIFCESGELRLGLTAKINPSAIGGTQLGWFPKIVLGQYISDGRPGIHRVAFR